MPTSVGVRYGQSSFWLEAFLGGLGADDFRLLAQARGQSQAQETGICLGFALLVTRPSCPCDGFTFLTASPHCSMTIDDWCRNI